MDKTFGYYLERYIGLLTGIIISVLIYKNWCESNTILKDKYYDLIIKVGSSIFGFLLTILALIVNSSSKSVVEMREHKSYKRLIQYNKVAVYLLFTIILFSVIMYLILAQQDGIIYFSDRYTEPIFRLLISIHAGLCIWSAIDTTIFVRIFYKIILSNTK